MLRSFLEADSHSVIKSHGDAGTDIVSEALWLATQGNSVIVAVNDTDILVLILYQFSNDMADIYLLSESKQPRRKLKKLISIRELAEKTSCPVLQNLLLIHSWGRCDATYAFYGHRKCAIIKIIQKSESVLSCCKTLANHTAFYIQIASAGSQIVVKIMAESPVIGLPQIYQVYGVCCNIN